MAYFRLKLFIVFTLSLLLHEAFAQVGTRIYVSTLKEQASPFAPGDVFSADIVVAPRSEGDLKIARGLENGRLGPFFVAKVYQATASDNNDEALKIEADLIVSEVPKGSEIVWDGPFGKTVVFLRGISFLNKKADVGKEILIADQPWNARRYPWPLVTGSVLLLIGVLAIPFLRRIMLAKREKKARREQLNQWINRLAAAHDRQSMEHCYLKKAEWDVFLSETSGSSNRLKTLEAIQYKREWTEEDEAAVKAEFSELKKKLETVRGVEYS